MLNCHLKENWIRKLLLPGLLFAPMVIYGQDSTGSAAPAKADTIVLLDKTQPAAALLQSTATVRNSQLITTPAPSFLQALPGRLAGLYTRQRSGVQDNDDPSGVIDFKIRGQVPLILIDGVPRDFASIEPESIESISVLKDALSTVLFGQRSSGNIILVTTQRPVASPFKLSFTAQHGLQQLISKTKAVSAADYAVLYNEARNNDGLPPVYTAEDIIAYRNGSDPLFHPNNDYRNYFLNKSAALDRYNLNIRSGNSIAKFYVAMDYQHEDGFFNTTGINTYSTDAGVDRYIVRSNVDVNLNKTLNIGLNIFGRIQDANQPGGGASDIMNALYFTPNNAYSIFNPDSSLGGNSTYPNNIYGMLNNAGYYKATTRDLAADLGITQRLDALLKGLWAKLNISYNNTVEQSVNRSKDFAVYNLSVQTGAPVYTQIGTNTNQPNTLSIGTRRTYTYGKFSLGYDKAFGDHNLNILALADRQATTIGLDLPAIFTNIAGNISYNFKQKYFAEAALSYGGHNRFKPGMRSGWFYAGALGMDLAKTAFLQDATWLNRLKPRIGFGQTGNANVGYYVYDQYYSNDGTSSGYYFGASPTAARSFSELALANPGATWEKAHKLNAGLDAVLLHNRLSLTAEYFNDTYFDLMQLRGNSILLIGQTYPAENVGRSRYTGFESNLTWKDHIKSLGYFISANFSSLQSKVLFQDEVYRKYDYQKRTGLPVGQPFGYIADGFFQSVEMINSSPVVDGYQPVPGDIRYRDLNNDGIINQFDEAAIGTRKPLLFYGATAGLDFKGFDLSISIQGVAHRNIVNSPEYNPVSSAFEYGFQNSATAQAFEPQLNRWTPSNAANATYPRLSVGVNTNNQRASSFWVQSADYLRIQNVDVGYSLPRRLIARLNLEQVRIFANGFNLYSFDKLQYLDPEGYNSVFPLRKTYNMGINIKF